MPFRLKILSVVIAVAMFAVIVRLVYDRRLREEYSWLWLLTGFLLLVFTLAEPLLAWVTATLGLESPVATLFLFATFFFMILSIHFSIRLTDHTAHIIKMSQEMSLLAAELETLKRREQDGGEQNGPCHGTAGKA